MADTAFVTARFPEAAMPKTQDHRDMLRRVHDFVPPKSLARLREAGDRHGFGPWRSEGDVLDRVDRRTSRMGVGPKLIVQRETDREQLSIREIVALPRIPDLGAAPSLELIHAVVWAEFDVRSGGLWLCRYIDGTMTVSRHGYLSATWKGAAEDIFVLSGGMPQLERVAQFVVAKSKAGDLDAATVIVNQSIWTAPDFTKRVYTGQQHFHCHVDVVGGHPCSP